MTTPVILPLTHEQARFLQNLLADAKRTLRSHAALAHVRSHLEVAQCLEAYAAEMLELMGLIERCCLLAEEPQIVLVTPQRLHELEKRAAHVEELEEELGDLRRAVYAGYSIEGPTAIVGADVLEELMEKAARYDALGENKEES